MAGTFLVVLLAYTAGAVLAFKSFGATFGPAFFYPSAGVTVAALIMKPRALWPVVIAAVLLAESVLNLYFWSEPPLTIGFAVANAVEPLLGASLVLAWCRGRVDLTKRRELFLFLAGACLLGPALGGLIGGVTTSLAFGKNWLLSVLKWWGGDALGVLVIATPILLWQKQANIVKGRPLETCTVLVLTAVLTVVGLKNQISPSMFVLPILGLAAFRLGMIGTALIGAVFAFATNVMTSRGMNIFGSSEHSVAGTAAVTQLYVGVTVVVGLVFAQEAAARTKAVREHALERRERLRLEGLSRLAQRLSAAMDTHDIGRALEAHVLNEAGAKALNLGLLNAKGTRLEWVVMAGYPAEVVAEFGPGVSMAERYVATDAVRTAEPVLIKSAAEYRERYGDKVRFLSVSGAQSVVSWPLMADGTPIGTLILMWKERQPLDRAQLAYVSTVAAMVSQALVRARVYADERARAAVLQSALLPRDLGKFDGIELHISYEPGDLARGIGSDWYDVMTLPAGGLYLAVGDVMGRGLASVEDMGQLRSAGRALALQGLPPSRILHEINGLVHDASHSDLVTICVAIYDPESETMSYCAAGHPPMILRRSATAEVVELSDAVGPALGPTPEALYGDGTVTVGRNDVVVMYTDGLVNTRQTGKTQAQLAIANWDASRSLSGACEELHATLAPRPREDDVCILAVRFGGVSANTSPAE